MKDPTLKLLYQNFRNSHNLLGTETELANARSIVNKTDKMYLEIESGSHDIVVLTETHLDDSILDSEIFP